MPGRVGESQPHARRKLLDAPFPLAKMLQQFQTVRMTEGLRDFGKAFENRLLWSHLDTTQIIQQNN